MMSGVSVSVSHALKTEPLVPAVFIKKFRAEIINCIHTAYISLASNILD